MTSRFVAYMRRDDPAPERPTAHAVGRSGVLEPVASSVFSRRTRGVVLNVAVGYVAMLRDAAHRRDGLAILAAGVTGYFLAFGNRCPTGGPFRLAYERVPSFVIMREPRRTIRNPQTYPR